MTLKPRKISGVFYLMQHRHLACAIEYNFAIQST